MNAKSQLIVDTDLLISYSQGILSPVVMQKIKHALEQDEVLMTEYQGILEHLDKYPDVHPDDALNESSHLTSVSASETKERTTKVFTLNSTRWKPLLAAASVVLLLGIGVFVWMNNAHTSQHILASVQTDEFLSVASYRGADEQWHEDYNAGNYKEVIADLGKRDSLTYLQSFFLGVSYFKTEDHQAAIAPLMKAKEAVMFKSDASLVLACVYAKLGNIAKALAACDESEHPQAAALKKELLSEKKD